MESRRAVSGDMAAIDEDWVHVAEEENGDSNDGSYYSSYYADNGGAKDDDNDEARSDGSWTEVNHDDGGLEEAGAAAVNSKDAPDEVDAGGDDITVETAGSSVLEPTAARDVNKIDGVECEEPEKAAVGCEAATQADGCGRHAGHGGQQQVKSYDDNFIIAAEGSFVIYYHGHYYYYGVDDDRRATDADEVCSDDDYGDYGYSDFGYYGDDGDIYAGYRRAMDEADDAYRGYGYGAYDSYYGSYGYGYGYYGGYSPALAYGYGYYGYAPVCLRGLYLGDL